MAGKRAPLSVMIARKTFGRRALPDPVKTDSLPVPDHFTDDERKEWNEQTAILAQRGMLYTDMGIPLEMLCEYRVMRKELRLKMRREKSIGDSKDMRLLITIENRLRQLTLQLGIGDVRQNPLKHKQEPEAPGQATEGEADPAAKYGIS